MSAVEEKPTVPAVEAAASAPAPVEGTPAASATEAKADEPAPAPADETPAPAEAVTTPPAVEANAEETAKTAPAEEAVKEEPVETAVVTEGLAKYKGPGFLHFLGKTGFFYLGGSEPVPAEKLKEFSSTVKAEVSRPIVAWASVTGEGILFGSHSKDQPIAHAFLLHDATVTSVKDKAITLTINSKKYTFTFESKSIRDGWLAGLNAAKAVADEKHESVVAHPSYVEAVKVPEVEGKAAPTEEAPAAETTAEAPAAEENPGSAEGATTTVEAESSPAPKPNRLSVFGGLLNAVRRPSGEVKAPVKEEEPTDTKAEEPAAEAAPTTEAAPAVEEPHGDETEVSGRKSTEGGLGRRKTILGLLKGVKKTKVADVASKATEATSEEPAPASEDASAPEPTVETDAAEAPAAEAPANEPAEASTEPTAEVSNADALEKVPDVVRKGSRFLPFLKKSPQSVAPESESKTPWQNRLSFHFRRPKGDNAAEAEASATAIPETAPQVDVPAVTGDGPTEAADDAAEKEVTPAAEKEVTPAAVAEATPAPEVTDKAVTASA